MAKRTMVWVVLVVGLCVSTAMAADKPLKAQATLYIWDDYGTLQVSCDKTDTDWQWASVNCQGSYGTRAGTAKADASLTNGCSASGSKTHSDDYWYAAAYYDWLSNIAYVGAGSGGSMVDTTIVMAQTEILTEAGSDDGIQIDFVWGVDGQYDPDLQGTFSLDGGGNATGTGIYAGGAFDVQPVGSQYQATYVGGNLSTQLPVAAVFHLDYSTSASGFGCSITEGTFQATISLPADYEFETVPEPATLSLLLLGGLGVMWRRRK